jgi:acyl transferase domain-containing protein/thioesterase domain-containing protein
VESIHFFSDEELVAAGELPERLRAPSYVKACGRLADIDKFDAFFFGVSPRDAAVFDPQHRFFLECAWEAFEDAGYVAENFPGLVGVFGSSGASEYMMYNLIANRHIMESVGAWLVRHNGNDTNFLATRVSYELNLRGPSVSVQTACSSSLVALHLACQSLLNGECDMALAGGTTIYPEQKGYFYKEGEILSPDGHCRPFDAQSAGTVMASAVGCVVLKRVEDARRDGDRVLAVIRGSAINNDGSQKVGYLAPSVAGQTRVISEALAIAGVDAEDISYVEAHGTGTLIGDPIEIAALTEAFRATTAKKQFCAIGSLKSNIGHAGEAAGICSLIKTVLALQHRQIPPSLHYKSPNPQADFPNSPFFVNAKLSNWVAAGGKPRVAGVTALGAGGTNVHVLVEEAPPAPAADAARPQALLVLSAKTSTALDQASKNLAAYLRSHPDVSLADVEYTLLVGRKGFAFRRALVAANASDAASALEGGDPKRVATYHQKNDAPSVIFMFPGGGAQYARMGIELYEREPVYRQAVDQCLSHLDAPLLAKVRALLFAAPGEAADASSRLEAPSLALPALFATEYAIAKLLESWGISPAAMIGHSAGEYAAACLAGVLTVRDAMTLVALRGRLFETLPEGGMLSVALSEEEARAILGEELSLAAVNAPSLCVASGPVAEIDKMETVLRAREIECTRVHIHVAAHSAMVEPILTEFDAFCRTVGLGPPKIPFVSNLTGTWITDAEATAPAYWVRHLRGTVRFNEGLQKPLETPNRLLLEIGPGRTLSSLARQQKNKPVAIVPTLRHPQEEASDLAFLLGAMGRLWVCRQAPDEARFFGERRCQRISLPTYPFERQRYWVDPDASSGVHQHAGELRKRADMADWFYAPSWARAAPGPLEERGDQGSIWLVFTDRSSLANRLVERLRIAGDRVVTVAPGKGFAPSGAMSYAIDPKSRSDYDALAADLRQRKLAPNRVLHLWALASRLGPSRLPLRRSSNALKEYAQRLALHHYSLVFFTQAFAADAEALRLTLVSSHMQPVPGDAQVHAEKAVLLGACKVIPRECPQVACSSIDIDYPTTRGDEERLATQIDRELRSAASECEVALRGADRWARRWDPIRLHADGSERPAVRREGVYLVTGGLGGIGLTVAEHLAKARAKLVLIGRTPFPSDEDAWLSSHGSADETCRKIARVRAMRALGAEVMTVAADVTDLAAMRDALARVRARFGAIDGVFHAAGQLKDELIELRSGQAESTVLDTKVKGALVLDALLEADNVELFVLFSSISSILGLPGQVDYTAANAFLDAFAFERNARNRGGRTLSINWNAWQQVGMLATRVREHERDGGPASRRPAAASSYPALAEVVKDDAVSTVFRTSLRRGATWLLDEHVVRGGEALIPGTGMLEIARAALEYKAEARAVELRDVFFLAPFVVGHDQSRTLRVRIDRQDHSFVLYGESEEESFATGKVAYVDAPAAPSVDLQAVRSRCPVSGKVRDGFLVQHFMDFGRRWGCVDRIDLGRDEALLSLQLPADFADDLGVFRLHPALLDMAVGGAQALLGGFDPKGDFYVPFSYGRVLLRRPLPGRFFSHVRLRQNGGKDSAIFDATLCDEALQEVATIESFVMRRVAPATLAVAPKSATAGNAERAVARPAESPEQAALREGMTPAEGVEALDRILSVPFSPQVVACTVDIHVWLDRLAEEARASLAQLQGTVEAGAPLFTRPNLSATFVAPRDTLERELAGLWGELLGVADIGVQDDFFELGGQSLIAVRMFHRIGKKYGVELPLATLFQAPTIAECAALLRAQLGPAAAESLSNGAAAGSAEIPSGTAPAFRAIVTVQRGDKRLPFFCVHGAGGNVLNFRDLSRAMDRAQPFYGLQAYGIDGVTPPHETIEEMARAYVVEVREQQPQGPYLLGGYSGGGLVAFEMAQILTEQGQEVRLLAFLDTFHPQMPLRRVTMGTRLARLRSEKFHYVVEALARQREVLRGAMTVREIEEHLSRGDTIPFALRDFHLTHSFAQAASRYRPKPWPGRAILFRAAEIGYIYQDAGPSYGWDQHVLGGVEIVAVPGNHATLLLGQNAEVLVRSLNTAIAQAQQAEAPRRDVRVAVAS